MVNGSDLPRVDQGAEMLELFGRVVRVVQKLRSARGCSVVSLHVDPTLRFSDDEAVGRGWWQPFSQLGRGVGARQVPFPALVAQNLTAGALGPFFSEAGLRIPPQT